MRTFSVRPIFDKQLEKFDPSTRDKVKKRMQKIIEKPELGKPLRAPLQKHFSERIEKYRIIYTYTAEHVEFVYIDHRDRVFTHASQFMDE